MRQHRRVGIGDVLRAAMMFVLMWIVLPLIAFALFTLWLLTAQARDLGQWEASDPAIAIWYRGLMRPDMPDSSCCGEADSYWADSFAMDHATGQYVAIITDDRDDKMLRRPHVPIGTRIVVPNAKIKWNAGNPTGHGVIFMSGTMVYCYVPPWRCVEIQFLPRGVRNLAVRSESAGGLFYSTAASFRASSAIRCASNSAGIASDPGSTAMAPICRRASAKISTCSSGSISHLSDRSFSCPIWRQKPAYVMA